MNGPRTTQRAGVTASGGSVEAMGDWTKARNGRTNSSAEFNRICKEVERLIRGDAFHIINGHADMTARLIVAQLAHVHCMAPVYPPKYEAVRTEQ